MEDFPPTLNATPSGNNSLGASKAQAYITCNTKPSQKMFQEDSSACKYWGYHIAEGTF